MQWKNGDTVRLKSGGPVMTIVDFSTFQKGHVCEWFVGNELKREVFPADALVSAPKAKSK